MSDEVDLAQSTIDAFLQASITKHQNNLKQMGDIEAEICNGCGYATKASWGKTCDSYRECLQDYSRAANAKVRAGASN